MVMDCTNKYQKISLRKYYHEKMKNLINNKFFIRDKSSEIY